MQTENNTDPELIDRLRNGDEAAFRLIFERFHRKIYQFTVCFLKDKAQSEEIVQETFLRFWLHREDLDPMKPYTPYLYTIARRMVIDYWRRVATVRNFEEHLHQVIELSCNHTENRLLVKDLERVTEEALNLLSSQQRMVFTLSRFEGLTYKEIALRMEISKETVKYHLVNALKVLREHLKKHNVSYTLLPSFLLYAGLLKL